MQDPQLGHRSARWGPLPPARTYCPFFLLMSPPSLARPSDRRPFAPARRSRAGQRWPGRKRARPPAPEASPGVGSAAPAGQPAWGHPQGLRTPGRASPSSVSIATQGVPHRPASPVPHPEWGKGASRARKGPGRPQPPEALLRPAPSTTKLGGGLCGREWGAEKGELQEQAKWRGLVRRGAGGGPGKGAGGGGRGGLRPHTPPSGGVPGRVPLFRASPGSPFPPRRRGRSLLPGLPLAPFRAVPSSRATVPSPPAPGHPRQPAQPGLRLCPAGRCARAHPGWSSRARRPRGGPAPRSARPPHPGRRPPAPPRAPR